MRLSATKFAEVIDWNTLKCSPYLDDLKELNIVKTKGFLSLHMPATNSLDNRELSADGVE